MFRQTRAKTAAAALLLAGGIAYGLSAGYYGRELLTEVAILAILVISLDLVAGYGRMVSLAHGALLFGAGVDAVRRTPKASTFFEIVPSGAGLRAG